MHIILRKGEPTGTCRRAGVWRYKGENLGAFSRYALWVKHPHAPGLSHSLPVDTSSNPNN
jgi:hypothetical protein